MARVHVHDKFIVIVSSNRCRIYDLRSDEGLTCRVPPLIDGPADDSSQSLCGKKDGSDQILAAAFSPYGKYFAVSNDHKQLTIWDVQSSWKQLNTRTVPRRATALVFTKSEDSILVADKAGDVHQFSVMDNGSSVNPNGILIAGHVSMLLDVKLCSSDKYLVTCDRDEKIRVSRFPNAYNIQSFCLGHTDFVSRLMYLEEHNLLLSGSGDGVIKLWNYVDGRLVDSIDCLPFLSDVKSLDADAHSLQTADSASAEKTLTNVEVRCLVAEGASVAVAFDCLPVVLLFTLVQSEGSVGVSFRQRLTLTAPVWDIAFVDSGRLLVLQSQEGNPALVFLVSDPDSLSDVTLLTEEKDADLSLLNMVKKINEDADLFKSLQAASHTLRILRKAHIDNMTEYIEKKKQMLKNKKLKEDASPDREDTTNKKQRLCS